MQIRGGNLPSRVLSGKRFHNIHTPVIAAQGTLVSSRKILSLAKLNAQS
jgi:hypothetical protein